MKHKLMIFALLLSNFSYSQWTTSGTNIYNTNSGNVGIGITNPSAKLHVNGILQLTNRLNQENFFANGISNADFGGLFIQSVSLENSSIGQNAAYYFSPGISKYLRNSQAALMQFHYGNIYFYTAPSGPVGGTIDWNNKPRVGIANQGGLAVGSSYAISATNPDGVLTVSSKVGIGTSSPSEQLHTTGTVRFAGLGTGTVTNLLGVDATGKLWKTSLSTGVQSNCSTVNFIPKLTAVNQLGCSQIFDNGTSVGINKTSGFGYVSGAILSNGSPTPPSTFALAVNGWTSSTAFVALSDKRLKKDINDLENALEKVLKLRGVNYLWNQNEYTSERLSSSREIGFLAQEVAEVLPETVIKTDDGIYGVNYNAIIPVLAEAIKELNDKIVKLEEKTGTLEEENNYLRTLVADLSKTPSTDVSIQKHNLLVKSYPNPSNTYANIEYQWSTGSSAYILFTSIEGKHVQKAELHQKGNGSIQLSTSGLTSGTYIYQLFIDNMLSDSKKLIVTK